MTPLVIIGGGGHAKVVAAILKRLYAFEILGYTDIEDKGELLGLPYLGNDEQLAVIREKHGPCAAVLGLGNVKVTPRREQFFREASKLGFELPVIIAPSAIINEEVVIEEGTVVMDGVVVNSGTRIGKGCIINTGSVIDHDCVIDDYVHIAPGCTLSGNVSVGQHSMMGTGAKAVQGSRIGEKVMVGAGAVVTRDLLNEGIYTGIPAKKK